MNENIRIASLVSEYSTLLKDKHLNNQCISYTLVKKADWSNQGANELLSMVNNYGAFMLRNALALAIVIGKEDGDLSY